VASLGILLHTVCRDDNKSAHLVASSARAFLYWGLACSEFLATKVVPQKYLPTKELAAHSLSLPTTPERAD